MRWLLLLLTAVACSPSTPAPKGGQAPPEHDRAGRLPPEQIQSIVREHYEIFRKCYEAGLARDPRLSGRVTVRFVIDREGRVSTSELESSTLPDDEATRCIVGRYRQLQFPAPEGGIVTVVYPISFSPG